MQTDLPKAYLATPEGARADEILRSCVHCGFCNATCPTYRLLGDELDGPRGRIYLIKDMLEQQAPDPVARLHLDRCLTCRACETTCPSGVEYGELLEIGRNRLEAALPRPALERWIRRWLLAVVPYPRRLRPWLSLGRLVRPVLPARLAAAIPPRAARVRDGGPPQPEPRRITSGERAIGRVLVLDGCVQGVATPDVNAALARLLTGRGIEVVRAPGEVCCGSLALHLGAVDEARTTMAANLDALAAALDGVDAVVSSASGCGVTVKDYRRLLAHDPVRREAAERISALTLDAAELLHRLDLPWQHRGPYRRVAWHSPCTLQHGQRVTGLVEGLLTRAGYELARVDDAHLCCGAAGTYSILQPELSRPLEAQKLRALQHDRPDVIATGNVGCQLHLAGGAAVPVVHWLQLLA